MISTAKLFAGCVTTGVTFAASLALAAPSPIAFQALASETVVSQKGGDSAAERRREADDLLRRARQAMKEGRLDAADELVVRAEKLHVASESIFARWVDTPEKIRKELTLLRAATGGVSKPSSRFVPSLLNDGNDRQPAGETNAPPRKSFDASETLTQDAAARSANALNNGLKSAFTLPPPDSRPDVVDRVPPLGKPRGFTPANDDNEINSVPNSYVPGERGGGRFPDPSYAPDEERPADRFQNGPAKTSVGDTAANDPRANGERPDNSFRPNRLPKAAADNRAESEALAAKRESLRLVALARAALDRGDVQSALQYNTQAKNLQVPDGLYGPNETRPALLGMEIARALNRRGGEVMQAGAELPETTNRGGAAGGRFPVAQGAYNPANDRSRVTPAQAETPTPAELGPEQPPEVSPGVNLYQQGLRALQKQDREAAFQNFREAWKYQGQLDPNMRQQLREKLNLLQTGSAPAGLPAGREPSALEAVDSKQTLLQQKLRSDLSRELDAAQNIFKSDPRAALQRIQNFRERVNQADLDAPAKKQMLTLVDRELNGLEKFIEVNRGDIENTARNAEVLARIDRDRRVKLEVQNKLAELVDQFNTLMDERRFPEAEVLAKQARELDPENPVVETLLWKAKFAVRIAQQRSINDLKEDGFYRTLESVDEADIPFDDRDPIRFMDSKKWADLSRTRKRWLEQNQKRMSPAEMEIQRSLKQPVEVQFTERPLKEVLETLARATDINHSIDPNGLSAEGITSDTPVTINLTKPISLKSALQLILSQHHLSYVIQNDVLLITSEQTKGANVYPKVYDVADLVIPIPNFMPGYNSGLPSAIAEAHRAIGRGSLDNVPFAGSGPLMLATNQSSASTSSSVLAQMGAGGHRGSQTIGPGPGGLTGGAQADYDTLIDLVTSTIAPPSWNEVGGPGSIEPGNLSIVVSQTQEVHDQIADLLEQLRRLQDLQVTVEVRFITLRDNFFERIGVDFDFTIDDKSGLQSAAPNALSVGLNRASTIGLTPQGTPTSDLNIPFSHGSRGSFLGAVPQFGGFDAGTAANFGVAILSDIEVFFLVQASQGDRRNNVLQSPKVTMFNGQTASVSDTIQRPFVTSIVPVVGDFAVAHQPVIVVLNEGTSLSVQAVVTADRRFVRLTLVPFFSRVTEVNTFTFNGKTTTRSGSNVKDPADPTKSAKDNVETTTEGTTVQLPSFAFTTVTTTVSVPDGGTVLLGGIKRLREGRDERGVPMLDKIPYISRLFKNVAIGRETESLMLMVTPRIIIQEEEELKLGLSPGS